MHALSTGTRKPAAGTPIPLRAPRAGAHHPAATPFPTVVVGPVFPLMAT